MRVFPMAESLLVQLEALGFRRAVLPKAHYPKLDSDVPTLDFGGFPSLHSRQRSRLDRDRRVRRAGGEERKNQNPGGCRSKACAAMRRQDRSTSRCTPPPNDSGASAAT